VDEEDIVGLRPYLHDRRRLGHCGGRRRRRAAVRVLALGFRAGKLGARRLGNFSLALRIGRSGARLSL
jgi:hypothetical protein